MSEGRRLVTGGLWATLDSWASELANLALYFLLARLLGPAEFGLVALASVFTTLAAGLTVYSVVPVIVQKPDLEPADCDAVFLLTMAGSTLTALLFVLAAPMIARLFGEPQLAGILAWLSLGLVLQAVGAVPLGLLTRELRFGATARRSLLMIACGGAVGIGMAMSGYGAWALVGQHVTGAAVGSVVLLAATGWRPGLRARWRHARATRSFVASAVGNRLLTFADERGPQLIIGYLLGPTATGLYNMALRLVEVITRLFVVPINQIVMPAFARAHADQERMQRLLRTTLATGTLISAPAFLGAAVLAPGFVAVVFGERWAAMVPVLQVLALRGVVWPLLLQGQSLLYGLGQPQRLLEVNVADLVVNLALLALAAPFGLLPVAAVMTARVFLWRWPLLAVRVKAATGLGWSEQARLLAAALLPAALMAMTVACVMRLLPPGLPALAELAAGVLTGAAAYLLLLLLLQREALTENLQRLLALRRSPQPGAPLP
jgi:O-antigen/teichoic acid export membrane protein